MRYLSGLVGSVAGLFAIAVSGCASASGSGLASGAPNVAPAALQGSPEAYQGQRVMMGGSIVALHPRAEGVDIEVAGGPLDSDGRPERGRDEGRFVVRSAEPLDTMAYAPGRSITAVGVVAPMESWWDNGDAERRYPVLTFAQLRLWPPDTTTRGAHIGQRYWVWPYTFWLGPPPYVPLVTAW